MYLLKIKSPELQQEKDVEISKPEKDLEERVCGSAEMAMWQGDKKHSGRSWGQHHSGARAPAPTVLYRTPDDATAQQPSKSC